MDGAPFALLQALIEFSVGKKTAKDLGAVAYMECSAKNDDGVDQLFEMACRFGLSGKRPRVCSIL